ncbi:MAG: putative baseplate assembly protein [Nitrospira sp.]
MLDLLNDVPLVDQRDSEAISLQVRQLLRQRIPDLKPSEVSDALIAVFARYSEILIEHINRAPHKALLTYVNLFGMSPQPPQSARVPLTFIVTPKCTEVVTVPKLTKVAGSTSDDKGQPVVFETESDLYVLPLSLVAVMSRDPRRDGYGNHSQLAGTVVSSAEPLFEAGQPTEHILYIGHSKLLSQASQELRIHIEATSNRLRPSSLRDIRWEYWGGKKWVEVLPISDTTSGLTREGVIVFTSVPGSFPQEIDSVTSAWFRARLIVSPTMSSAEERSLEFLGEMACIHRIRMEVSRRLESLSLEAVFYNHNPHDVSKEFYVFGENPRFGDVFSFTHAEAFGVAGVSITLSVELLNPIGGNDQVFHRETFASDDLCIQWEMSTFTGWQLLGLSEAGSAQKDATTGFIDETKAFTQSGRVMFVIPSEVGPQTINGVKAIWLRARIIAGNYGAAASYQPYDSTSSEKGYSWTAATLSPPIARTIRVSMESTVRDVEPESVMTRNDFSYRDVTFVVREGSSGFQPFVPMPGNEPVLHLGFHQADQASSWVGYPLSLYFHCHGELLRSEHDGIAHVDSGLHYEYWNGERWSRLSVEDRTAGLSRSGIVQFDIPKDWHILKDFDAQLFWIRVRGNECPSSFVQCRGVVPYTVMAQHAETLHEEVLGSSTGRSGQIFHTLRTPVLEGQVLRVGEPPRNPGGDKIWVEWKSVPNFLHSGSNDCHYTVDRQSGVITFGDGARGAIPSAGVDNIVIKEYRIGGGHVGNVPTQSLVQLRTTIPFVQQVFNHVPGVGGTNGESLDAFVRRAVRTTRHHNRAVTLEDYQDMARAVSPLIARVHCVPSYDLARDPAAEQSRPGVVSMIVLPHTNSKEPKPDAALLDLVRTHVQCHAPTGVKICVASPRYVPLHVEMSLVVQRGAVPAVVQRAAINAIEGFLHPVTGASDGLGWAIGVSPARSALQSVLMNVSGVHHVQRLQLQGLDKSIGIVKSGYFHVCSGKHVVYCQPDLEDKN